MAYLKHNVNFVIASLLIFSIIIIVAAATFFHLILNDLSNKYENARDNIDEINTTLVEEQARFEETQEELELRSERESQLSSEFSKIEGQNLELAQTKKSLESQLSSARNDVAKYQREVNNLNRDLQALNSELNDARAAIFTLSANFEVCIDEKSELEDDLAACQGS